MPGALVVIKNLSSAYEKLTWITSSYEKLRNYWFSDRSNKVNCRLVVIEARYFPEGEEKIRM